MSDEQEQIAGRDETPMSATERIQDAVAHLLEQGGITVYRNVPCHALPFAVFRDTSDADEVVRLRTENEQLRALVSDCENRIYRDSWRMEYNGKEESEKEDAELRDIQQRAKALGIKVSE